MDRPVTVSWLAACAVIGIVIGLLVALCDGPGPGTLVSRFLALVSPVTALLPFFGIIFTGAAYVANRNHPGVYRTISRISVILTALISLASVWILWK